jgi:hypothetical protein
VATGIIEQLEQAFGKEAPLSINRGKVHDYLGMMLDFSTPGKAKILMIDWIENMLEDMPAKWDSGAITLGKGVVYGTLTRQKLNTKSSTEAELVGIKDVMPHILWTQYFLEAPGYDVTDSIVNQDYQSAILLENNGCASSGK